MTRLATRASLLLDDTQQAQQAGGTTQAQSRATSVSLALPKAAVEPTAGQQHGTTTARSTEVLEPQQRRCSHPSARRAR